jgi:uncharacterized protein (DUF2235 family)
MKRLILCADGTWNVRDQLDENGKRRPTNVTKLARAIRARDTAGIDQVVFYHDGIGTRGPLDKLTGGAFGEGVEANIRNLYRFVVYNYVPGDAIFLFGFSRGAFTVRSLAGFLKKVGLIGKDDDYYVPDLYACYEKNKGEGTPEWEKAFHRVKKPLPCPPITCIGVWDTVGALGAPGWIGKAASAIGGNKYGYHDVTLNDTIKHAYHALAIDERRGPFKPDLWTRPARWSGQLEQGWFPGVHSNIGGGYTPDGLANEALHWIVSKVKPLGLELDEAYLAHFEPHYESVLHDSMSLKYRVFRAYDRPIGEHLADGEFVHRAALDRWKKCDNYRPKRLDAFLHGPGAPLLTI